MWALAVNPSSGAGRGAKVGVRVNEYLERNKIEFQSLAASNIAELRVSLSTFIQSYPRSSGIIAVGGDGLFHEVLQLTTPADIPLAVVPAGTGNDFVRTLGWPLDGFDTYLDHVLKKPPRRLDLGLVDGTWFGAILSTGFDSIVNEKANSMRWPKGAMRYNMAIAMELPRFAPRQYEIALDDRHVSTQAMLIAVANGRSYGGGMLVAPAADIHDGFFDVMILHPVSKFEFLKVFPQVFKGTHINHPAVEILRSKSVRIAADAIAYADGERIGELPFTAQCMSSAMQTWTR